MAVLFRGEQVSEARELIDCDGVSLAVVDFGGRGQTAVMLHGLLGYATEWHAVASKLRAYRHLVAFDQRGHGRSDQEPEDMSRSAFVSDVLRVVEKVGVAPPVDVIGQSLGAHTAFLLAAEHPHAVRSLCLVDPAGPAAAPEAAEEIRRFLSMWPIPFASWAEASAFVADATPLDPSWVDDDALFEAADGVRPRWVLDRMVAAVAELGQDRWAEWERVSCPTLIVRSKRDSILPLSEAEEMVERSPLASLVSVDAGHDVHLEAPAALAAAFVDFLSRTQRK